MLLQRNYQVCFLCRIEKNRVGGAKKKNPKQTPSAFHTCDLGDSPEQVNSAWIDYQRHATPQG